MKTAWKMILSVLLLVNLVGCITVVHEAPPTQVIQGDGAELQDIPVIQEKEERLLEPVQEEQIQEKDPEPVQEKELEPVQEEKTLMQEFITDLPRNYWYFTISDFIGARAYDATSV